MKWEDGEKRLEAVEKARKLGFEVLTPDINRSQETVTINKKGQIIFGLGDIDQVGDKAVHDIIESRPFIDFDDFMGKRTPRHTNVRTVRHLIESGAFDKFGRRDELYYSITPDETPKTWEDQEMFLRQMSVLDLPPEVPMIEYFDNPFPVDTTEIRSIDWNEIRDEMYVKGVITSTTLKTGYGYMNINDGTGMVNVLMGEEILKIYEDVINRGVGTPVIIKVHMVKERTRLYADMIVPLDNYQNYEREIQYFDGSTETYADELAKYTSEHVGVVTSSNYFISKRGNRGTRLMLSNGLMFMCFDKMDKDIRAGDIVTYTISNEPFINVKEVR
jgi:DNA polymerase III alpha subunit